MDINKNYIEKLLYLQLQLNNRITNEIEEALRGRESGKKKLIDSLDYIIAENL